MSYFTSRVALVTGGSSGIGEAIAAALCDRGATVVIAARREPELQRVVADIRVKHGEVSYVVADLSDLDACDRLVAHVVEQHGRIDILVNNAGRSIRRPLEESLERFHDIERVMQINFWAPVRLIRGALPHMREAGFGHIVNILSAGAGLPSPGYGAYTTSKAALAQLGETLASEMAHRNIFVTSAFLPFVRTPMVKGMDDASMMSPADAAKYVLDGVARQKSRLVTPLWNLGRGVLLVAPSLVNRTMNAAFRRASRTRKRGR